MSLDDVDFSQEDKVPILCLFCSDKTFCGEVLGFVFQDDELTACPKCGKEGCIHWCNGLEPCDWCKNGIPDGFYEPEEK